MKLPVQNRSAQFGRVLAVALAWWFPAVGAVAADDYLGVLEEEASATGARTTAATTSVQHVQDKQIIPAGLGFEAFEAELHTGHAGTWFLYAKLSGQQRKAVFSSYQQDNRISAVREEIVRQLSSG